MTDLEMTKRCAEAMGMRDFEYLAPVRGAPMLLHAKPNGKDYIVPYDPLWDDAQAMALVKRFSLVCKPRMGTTTGFVHGRIDWMCREPGENKFNHLSLDLNRAIVECVAKAHGNLGKKC